MKVGLHYGEVLETEIEVRGVQAWFISRERRDI